MTQQLWVKECRSFRPSTNCSGKRTVFPPTSKTSTFRAIPRLFRNNVRLAGSFVPETFDGDLLFFAAVENSPASRTDAWRPYVRGQITIRQIACQHAHMTKPGPIAQIGQALAVELEKTTQKPSQPKPTATERPEL